MSQRGSTVGQSKRPSHKGIKSTGHRTQAWSQHGGRRTTGPIAELPLLRYGPTTNFEEFKRKITIYAEREYSLLGSIVAHGYA